jgi:hypothetical protein
VDKNAILTQLQSVLSNAPRERQSEWNGTYYDAREAVKFATLAETSARALFPAGHPVVVQIERALRDAEAATFERWAVTVAIKAAIEAAVEIVSNGAYDPILQGVQAETVGELLDQAQMLNDAGFQCAAMVLAGGALETQLLHLCTRANAAAVPSPGSIEKYKAMLDIERKNGKEVISVNDGKQVTAWGGARNDAAHGPTKFTRSKEEVAVAIDGIRLFLSRYP